MDMRMPGIDGMEATRRIVADPRSAAMRVIVLTTFERDEYVFDALRHGASGFLLKDAKPAELLRAVRTVADGGALLSPSVTRTVVREFVSRRRAACARTRSWPRSPTGSARSSGWSAEGLSNDEIAERLGQSGHGPHPREPGDDQARRPRPGPTGRLRVPVRPGPITVRRIRTSATTRFTIQPSVWPAGKIAAAGSAGPPAATRAQGINTRSSTGTSIREVTAMKVSA